MFTENTMYLLNVIENASRHYPARSFSLDKRGSFWFAEIYTGIYANNKHTQRIISSGPQENAEEALTKLIAEAVKDRLQ